MANIASHVTAATTRWRVDTPKPRGDDLFRRHIEHSFLPSIPGTVTPFRHSVSTSGWRSQGSKDNGRFSDPFFLRSYNSNLARSLQTPFLNHSSTWIIRNIQCSHLIVEPHAFNNTLETLPFKKWRNDNCQESSSNTVLGRLLLLIPW